MVENNQQTPLVTNSLLDDHDTNIHRQTSTNFPINFSSKIKLYRALIIIFLIGIIIIPIIIWWKGHSLIQSTSKPRLTATPRSGTAKNAIPTEVVKDVSEVVSSNPEIAQQAVYTGFPKFSVSNVAPLGTQTYVIPGTWMQKGQYGNVTAVVTIPGKKPVKVDYHFALDHNHWRILYGDTLPSNSTNTQSSH